MFIDAYAGEGSEEKTAVADRLGIRIAPGHYSLLISRDRRKIRSLRKKVDFVAAIPGSKQELNSLLTDTHYDFFIIRDFRLGKRNVRMAKRYEAALAVPVVLSRLQDLSRARHNALTVQDLGGTLLLCSGAASPEQLRAGDALADIGVFLGLKPDYARKAVREFPLALLKRNERRKKQRMWGVEDEAH